MSMEDEEPIEGEHLLSQECKNMIISLPRERGWRTRYLYFFQDFWCQSAEIQSITKFQNHFQAKDTDIIIATIPKSGTTWLKALAFAIANRGRFAPSEKNHPLLTSNSHVLVPFLEYTVYGGRFDHVPDLSNMVEPRLFGTHIPYHSLAKSIKDSNCKIIYICRNPLDTVVSTWIFINKIKPEYLPTLTLEEAFEMYCEGKIGYGPSWNHMLGYWNESTARPEKVLFLKYENLKKDTIFHAKKLGEFLGCPFTIEEENNGLIESIIKLCSFENMRELEVNKSGTFASNFENKYLFRKAQIGDWINYFSPSMVEKLSKILQEKLNGSGLSFEALHS
ncbi:hypothetical protein HN51_045325 [Arachis hypogaea]|uniref:Sulfotransferase n=1 Tax=Arachis hypogaea TaxID=3818 RepID=A0A444XZ47_ARAHY|nr:cytosolic sulfotransferase 15 [Arachis ipaensis]XP_025672358.1 cytosolic sulfotransferase 15 [Arachis hypogaea]QHN97578.1 Cytosolic sulfotransferase [Arachis hypogaea]RYQ94962.1 hypothetical protein Ahy_B08g089941 [Arachis hypogaea]